MNLYSIPPLVAGILTLAVGLVSFLSNRRAKPNVTFFLVTLSVFFWLVGYALVYSLKEYEVALAWARRLYVGVVFIPVTSFHFAVAITHRERLRRLIPWVYVSGVVFAAATLSNSFISGVREFFWGFQTKVGPLHNVFLAFFLSVMGMVLYLLADHYRRIRKTAPLEATRIRYVLLSYGISVAAAIDFLPNYGFRFYPFGFLFITIHAVTTTYALVRYRLLDANVLIARLALFVGVFVILLACPFGLAYWGAPALTARFGSLWWILPMSLMGLCATAAPLLFLALRRKAEAGILAEQRRYQQLLVVAAEGMLKILDLKKLLRRIVAIMVKYVRLEYAAVYLQEDPGGPFRIQARFGDGVTLPETIPSDDTLIHYLGAAEGPVVAEELKRSTQEGGTRKLTRLSEWLIRMKASVVVPAFLKDTHLLGFLVLGSKLSGQMFTSDDLRTFNALAHQVAIAIQNARFHRRGVDLGQMATGHQQLAAWGHEMGNVLHIGTIQVGVLKSRLQESPEMLPREKLLEQLGHIEKVLLRGHDVIDDVKEYLRCTEQPGIHAFPLAQFLKEAVDKLRERFKDCPHIKVALDLPDNLPTVEGLSTLSLLPLNLLAIPFWGVAANAAGGTITIKALTDAERSHVELVVSDDVTDPLRKHVEDSTRGGEESLFPTRSRHGAFYYFAVKKTVADHGGKLAVLDGTAAEKGTTILVRLPVKYSPPKPEGEEDLLEDAA